MSKTQAMSVSIIIPTYNERQNIEILLPMLERLFRSRDYEILVVDDSSPDGTGKAVLRRARRNCRIRLITRTKKEGIGAALREGYCAAHKQVIASTDADLSFAPKDLVRIVRKVESGYDLVVGARHVRGGSYERPTFAIWLKSLVSKLGNKVLTRLLRLPVHDMSANFRAIRKEVWDAIETQEKGNVLLGEMIVKAHKKGFKVGEAPVIFRDRRHGESKLNLAKEAPKFFIRIIRYIFP